MVFVGVLIILYYWFNDNVFFIGFDILGFEFGVMEEAFDVLGGGIEMVLG